MAAKNINLLPTGSGGSKIITKNLKIAQQIAYVAIFLSMIVIVSMFAFNFYLNRNLITLKDNQSRLKNNISSLEETEERLILTKDRVEKISQILSARLVNDNYDSQRLITDNLPDNLVLSNLEITREGAILELVSTNSRDLVRFMASLVVLSDIETIEMESLQFNSSSGYTLVLSIK